MARSESPPAGYNFIFWYKDVFGFTNTVAKVSFITNSSCKTRRLTKLSDSKVDSITRAICRTQAIAEISAARLKLAIFWIKHQDRTQREIGVPTALLVKVDLNTIMLLKTQKQLKDEWRLSNKEPNNLPVTLDLALTTKTHNKNMTILSRVRGVAGIPLSYVIRNILYPPFAANDPAIGEPDSAYSSIDSELISGAPILHENADELTMMTNFRPMAHLRLIDLKRDID